MIICFTACSLLLINHACYFQSAHSTSLNLFVSLFALHNTNHNTWPQTPSPHTFSCFSYSSRHYQPSPFLYCQHFPPFLTTYSHRTYHILSVHSYSPCTSVSNLSTSCFRSFPFFSNHIKSSNLSLFFLTLHVIINPPHLCVSAISFLLLTTYSHRTSHFSFLLFTSLSTFSTSVFRHFLPFTHYMQPQSLSHIGTHAPNNTTDPAAPRNHRHLSSL